MLPLPTSGAVAVNMLGDKVGTENDLQRVIQVLSGGNYPYVPNEDNAESAPYRVLFDTGYRPPSISSIKGYNINGERRPMTDEELTKYTKLRGQYLKEELSNLGPGATKSDARSAFTTANERALSEVGVDTSKATVTATRAGGGSAGLASSGGAGSSRLAGYGGGGRARSSNFRGFKLTAGRRRGRRRRGRLRTYGGSARSRRPRRRSRIRLYA